MAETKNGISNLSTSNRKNIRGPLQTNGTVRFSEEVIATIAFLASADVKGVAARLSKSDITEERMIKKTMLRGIKVRFSETDMQVDIPITVKPGFKAVSVAENVQSCVRKNLENMTGMPVAGVNVVVAAIQYKPDNE